MAKGWKTADGRIEAALVVQALLGDEEETFQCQCFGSQVFGRRGCFSLKCTFC